MNQPDKETAATSSQPDDPEPGVEELKLQVQRLERENSVLHQLDDYRAHATSQVAHELRTPLTSILGFAEILLSHERLTPQQRNFCERIHNSGQQLQYTLTQLSEIAHLDTGSAGFTVEEFALEDLLAEVSNSATTRTTRHGVHLDLNVASDLQLITCDRGKLRQALRLLLDYMFAVTEPGAHIAVVAQGMDSSCAITIKTNGGSITERPDLMVSSHENLTLAVARHILGLLGATLICDGNHSHGGGLVVELPLQPPVA